MAGDRDKALDSVYELLSFIGVDAVKHPGVYLDTPHRVVTAWEESWGKGYREPPPVMTLFDSPHKLDQMITVRDIQFYSTCEHHLAPFFGTCDIAYIPVDGVVGLSKLGRAVEHFARRLQMQERLTDDIATFLEAEVSRHVAVRMKAVHFCMVSRGIAQPNANTITTSLRGDFLTDSSVKAEFLVGCR